MTNRTNGDNVQDGASPFGDWKEPGFDRKMGRPSPDPHTAVKSVLADLP